MAQITKDQTDTSYDVYVPYLEEIRKRLLITFVVLIVTMGIGVYFHQQIIILLLSFFDLEGINIVFTSPFQFLELAFTSGILLGGVVVIPLLLFQALLFLRPALSNKEFKTILFLLPLGIILFVIGLSFGLIVMKYIVITFYERSLELDIGNFLDISKLISQILITGLLMGLAFQFPIVLTMLMFLKVLKYKVVANQRIIAYASSLIFAAILPPTDLLSLILLTLPLIVLFEVTLLLNRAVFKTHLL